MNIDQLVGIENGYLQRRNSMESSQIRVIWGKRKSSFQNGSKLRRNAIARAHKLNWCNDGGRWTRGEQFDTKLYGDWRNDPLVRSQTKMVACNMAHSHECERLRTSLNLSCILLHGETKKRNRKNHKRNHERWPYGLCPATAGNLLLYIISNSPEFTFSFAFYFCWASTARSWGCAKVEYRILLSIAGGINSALLFHTAAIIILLLAHKSNFNAMPCAAAQRSCIYGEMREPRETSRNTISWENIARCASKITLRSRRRWRWE